MVGRFRNCFATPSVLKCSDGMQRFSQKPIIFRVRQMQCQIACTESTRKGCTVRFTPGFLSLVDKILHAGGSEHTGSGGTHHKGAGEGRQLVPAVTVTEIYPADGPWVNQPHRSLDLSTGSGRITCSGTSPKNSRHVVSGPRRSAEGISFASAALRQV